MLSRGLAALTLYSILSTALFAEFLYKDEVVFIESFEQEIEKIGKELKEKTGVGLYVAVIKELDANQSIVDYEKAVIAQLPEPAVLLVLADYDKQIDIIARPTSLYKDFDKDQVLSPMPNSGTILPILTMKAKKATMSEKFAAAVQNGYTDMAEQIASSRDVVLENAVGSSNKLIINIFRVIFYGVIVYAIFMLIRNKIVKKKESE